MKQLPDLLFYLCLIMTGRIKHTAFFLLLVFSLPVIYQSWHNLSHHLHELSENQHHVCSIDNRNESSCKGEEQNIYTSPSDEVLCIVKDYEFSIKDLPGEFTTSGAEFNYNTFSNAYLHPGYKNFNKSAKSSRAPPSMS